MTQTMAMAHLAPGFTDPVFDAQNAFRRILDAYAYPGRPQSLPATPTAIGPLTPASAVVCLALADFETPIWFDPACDLKPVRDYLGFHCGAAAAAGPEAAAFAIVADALTMPRLSEFALGSDMQPQDSTTVIIQVPSLAGGPAVSCSGPGIPDRITLAIAGLPAWFWPDWSANRDFYPLGIDVLLTAGNSLIALPRSIRVEG
jgi:alpha-D-ribose 1-methylphosphonate 5-triphosphate synthase subunit PhnH